MGRKKKEFCVELDKTYTLRTDSYQFILEEKLITKKRDGTGAGERIEQMYYNNIAPMFITGFRRKIRGSKAQSLEELGEAIIKAEKEIKRWAKKLEKFEKQMKDGKLD